MRKRQRHQEQGGNGDGRIEAAAPNVAARA
jgi:hypothetical protein